MDENSTKTWPSREKGPPCRVCGAAIDRGHRYYDEGETVVHYCCKQREKEAA